MRVYDTKLNAYVLDRKKKEMCEIAVRHHRQSFANLRRGLIAFAKGKRTETSQWPSGELGGYFVIGCKRFTVETALRIAIFLLDKQPKKK